MVAGNPLPSQLSSNASHGCWSNPSTFIGTNWSTEACIPQMARYNGGFVSVTSGVFKNWDFQLNVHGVRAFVRAQIEHASGVVRLSGSFSYETLGPWNPGYEGRLLSMNTDASWATESCIVSQPPSAEQQCLDAGGYWDGQLCFYSPIVIDGGAKGISLTDPAGGVMFDADGDGVRERMSWTAAGADDAWLALDRNGNRLIDNGSELFGNFTVLPDGRTRAANGFDALKALDGGPAGLSTMDGLIDANDSIYARLLLWTDSNHNGMSEPDELLSLAQSGIVALRTDYKESRRQDEHGNLFRQRAKVIWTTADGFAHDVWLRKQ